MFGLGKKKDVSGSAQSGPAAPPPAPPAPPPAPPSGPIAGLMQKPAVNLASILEHAARYHGGREMVSFLPEGPTHRQTYRDALTRTKRLANALARLGMKPGDRVATLALNTHRHLEAWYAVSGSGAICHTVNPRLFPQQIVYIMNHAEDSIAFFDVVFTPLIDKLRAAMPNVKHWIVNADRAHMPPGDYICYEELIEAESAEFTWASFDENTASSLCYTSGTTGDPKGVLYSHRSNFLQATAITSRDVMSMGATDVALMVVPMFHANSWGMAYGVPMIGAKLVLPGMALDGPSVHRIVKSEGVTMSAAVPTVWTGLLQHLEATGSDLAPLREVMIGGSAAPRAMIDIFHRKYNVQVIHAWGMTEMSPLGTVNRPVPGEDALPYEQRLDLWCKQGRPPYGVDMKIVDDAGKELPWDGKAFGRLLVRGPWVVESYFGRPEKVVDAEGWFDTGDIATIDQNGYMGITDRAKDVIKSGGEWISSVDLENCAIGHPAVALACAIGVKHPKWEERPILLVKLKPGAPEDTASILAHLEGTFAKWQLPDAIVFVDELPLTATGKLDKKVLREKYAEHLMGAE